MRSIPWPNGKQMKRSKENGEIITFYSYKGGTGRSMALANCACILAAQQPEGDEVLMIDWDLEAPGLHRFFQNKFQRAFGQRKNLPPHWRQSVFRRFFAILDSIRSLPHILTLTLDLPDGEISCFSSFRRSSVGPALRSGAVRSFLSPQLDNRHLSTLLRSRPQGRCQPAFTGEREPR
jgi:hypothetical protein